MQMPGASRNLGPNGMMRERPQVRSRVSFRNRLIVGDVVLVKRSLKPRPFWVLAGVVELISGMDGVVRTAKVKRGCAVQIHTLKHLFRSSSPYQWTGKMNCFPCPPLLVQLQMILFLSQLNHFLLMKRKWFGSGRYAMPHRVINL